jgi:hypothetical protein
MKVDKTGAPNKVIVQWGEYRPSLAMRDAIDSLNRLSLPEVEKLLPSAARWTGKKAVFNYRVFSKYNCAEVEKVYVIIGGFAERADTLDAGVKGLLVDRLLKKIDTHKYAVVVIGGLFSFPASERRKFQARHTAALPVAAEEIANLLKSKFRAVKDVTVSGYSMGGTMAPLVAEVIIKRHIASVDQVCCGEPAYADVPTTWLGLLKRIGRASAYRNEQITASGITAYIAIKKTPPSTAAMMLYRAGLYRPLLLRLNSMRFIARDLASQARQYVPTSSLSQLHDSLRYLAAHKININLLRAEHSILCEEQAFSQLVDDLRTIAGTKVHLILIEGDRADHGIEEQRSLSTPFLVVPDMY